MIEGLTKEQRKALKNQRRLEKNPDLPIVQGERLTILCVRFGNKYGRSYVERLRNMIARNITVPYELVCLTDDQHPIEGVRSIVQPQAGYQRLWWHKVHMFDPSLLLSGRILYFDLDIIICNNVDRLAAGAGNKFLGIKDFNRKFHPSWNILNSSVMSWIHGSQSHIFNDFKSNPAQAQKLMGDQDWIWKVAKDKITFWPDEVIQSYKWEIRNRSDLVVEKGKRQFKSVLQDININPNCCVAVFHGDPKPEDVRDKFVIDNWR
jgi:hypothetical protein